MKILITGGRGMLAVDVAAALGGHDVVALSRQQLDITDPAAVRSTLRGFDAVVNTAAFTNVDGAEDDERRAFAVNAEGAENLARAAEREGARLVQLSTDYVFDGRAQEPYETDHQRAPINAYGRTKAEGEVRVLTAHPEGAAVVRTAWLYGANGPNFARTMLTLAADRETVSVVDDQWGQPTWTRDLATTIANLLDADAPGGIYHATNSGSTTWFAFAREIFALAGMDAERIRPTSSTSYARPARRPAYSVLSGSSLERAGLEPLRPWRAALAEAMSADALA